MLAQAEPAGASVTELANELRPILVRLARELRKETTHLGITGGQATLLWQISEHPGIGLRALAELEGILPALAGHGAVEIVGQPHEDPLFATRVAGGLRGYLR